VGFVGINDEAKRGEVGGGKMGGWAWESE